jgi:hypothetical protein
LGVVAHDLGVVINNLGVVIHNWEVVTNMMGVVQTARVFVPSNNSKDEVTSSSGSSFGMCHINWELSTSFGSLGARNEEK